jgi:hypothetical protein
MFRDRLQAARACRVLLRTLRLERLWTLEAPTAEAVDLLAMNGGPLSSGERVLLLAAFALWNGDGSLKLVEVVQQLDVTPAHALCALISALKDGPEAVDAWLKLHDGGLRISGLP